MAGTPAKATNPYANAYPAPLPNVSYINGVNPGNTMPMALNGGISYSTFLPQYLQAPNQGVSVDAVSGRDALVRPSLLNGPQTQVFNTPGANYGQYFNATQSPNAAFPSAQNRINEMIGSQQIGAKSPDQKSALGPLLIALAAQAAPAVLGTLSNAGHAIFGPSAVANATGGQGGAGGSANVSGNFNQSQTQKAQPAGQNLGFGFGGGTGLYAPTAGGGVNFGASGYYGNAPFVPGNGGAPLIPLAGYGQPQQGYDPYVPFTPGFTGGINGTPNATPYNGGYDPASGSTTMDSGSPVPYNQQSYPPTGNGLDTPYFRQTGSLMNPGLGLPLYQDPTGAWNPNPNYDLSYGVPSGQTYNPGELDAILGGTYQYSPYQPNQYSTYGTPQAYQPQQTYQPQAPSGVQEPAGLMPFTNDWNTQNPQGVPSGYAPQSNPSLYPGYVPLDNGGQSYQYAPVPVDTYSNNNGYSDSNLFAPSPFSPWD